MIVCSVMPLDEVVEDAPIRRTIRDELTKPGSDFHKAIDTKTDGHIAVVFHDDQVVGWARTERWQSYDTLEAFVRPERRLQGIAVFAAAGLFSAVLRDEGGTVAVFHPHMLLVARRAGFWPVLFERDVAGGWRRA
jgi:hypothetical protein